MLTELLIDNLDRHPEDLKELAKVVARFEIIGYIIALERVLLILSEIKDSKKDLDTAIKLISELQTLAYEKLSIIESHELELQILKIKKS